MRIPEQIPSVNYHLWRPCNMKCGFCFATFKDIDQKALPMGHLGCAHSLSVVESLALSVVESLAQSGFEKINFAGGEPTLCPWLPDLIGRAKGLGMTTSVVTNGSLICGELLDLSMVLMSSENVRPIGQQKCPIRRSARDRAAMPGSRWLCASPAGCRPGHTFWRSPCGCPVPGRLPEGTGP